MPDGFVHLDVRSFFSLKEGAFSPEALARRAAELHLPSVALVDRDRIRALIGGGKHPHRRLGDDDHHRRRTAHEDRG